ncbi:hypothetical protein CEXT_75281 [Caerostris extrusa]|uniref:Uncharacterized protein n=1 Tax=Caerostris extrusa TaxID=172846 RepID=A0AAV4PWV4_CAEEX|nr:hypothetical protein CEXT_75281 [Caerostris extrusa]
MQLLTEIRIHLRALLQPLFSEMLSFCTYAITVRDSNPLMGSTAVFVLKHDEIMHLCNYYLRFESTYGSTTAAVFRNVEFLQLCNYCPRFESTYGLYCSLCFKT